MSLAITEKRQQRRPGGCVGIFLQFLDWNRRLAKKKLASKKLPPPVRAARRASRKFGIDEKMPIAKLILIADENRGSFPNKKKTEVEVCNSRMRAPGLVARLMGLESMPVVAHERPSKSTDSDGVVEKAESRPPKLRKTGEFLLQRQPAEHIHLVRQNASEKNATPSRSSSKHHTLVPQVKSPILLSGSNRARLMQAATKILESGSQRRHHAKSSIPLVDSSLALAETTGSAADQVIHGSNLRPCMNCGVMGPSAFQFSIAPSSCTHDVQKSRFDPFVQAQFNNVHERFCEIQEKKQQLWNRQNDSKLKPKSHNDLKGNSLVRGKVADHQMTCGDKVCIRKAVRRNDLDELRRSTGQVSNTCSEELGRIGRDKNMACKRKNMNQDGAVSGSSYRSKRGVHDNQLIRGKHTRGKEDPGRLSSRYSGSTLFAINSQLMNSAKSPSLNLELASTDLGSEGRINSRGKQIRSLVEQRISKDELETTDTLYRASILEELITSLSTGGAPPDESCNILPGTPAFSNPQYQMSGTRKEQQKKAKSRTAGGIITMENDQLSPISILEASFSNDTCSSGSVQACSVNKSHSGMQSVDMDIGYLDSTTSEIKSFIHSTAAEAKQSISNPWIVDFAAESFILDTLETTVGAFPTSPSYNQAKEKDQVRQCLSDCMFQSLASKYSHFCKAGWKNSFKAPFFGTPNGLTLVREEVYDEIRGWISLTGKFLDDLIEKEMSDSNAIWRDREIEVFETGVEIERQMLQTLVDEMVKDFS